MTQVTNATATQATTATATSTSKPAQGFVNHQAKFNFKTVTKGADNAKSLEQALEENKLPADQVEVENHDDGKVTLKRKSVVVTMPVFDASALVAGEIELDDAQVSHLQAILNRYAEDKQKPLVDEFSDSVVNFAELLRQPYTVRQVAVKVTADMVKAAVVALKVALEGKVTEKGIVAIANAAEKKFSAAAVRGFNPTVLEKMQSAVLEAAETLDEAGELTEHEAVFDLWATNLGKQLQPAEEISQEDFF